MMTNRELGAVLEAYDQGDRVEFLNADADIRAEMVQTARELYRLRVGIKALAAHVEKNSCGGVITRLRALLDGEQS